MTFETVRQESRHINFFTNQKSKKKTNIIENIDSKSKEEEKEKEKDTEAEEEKNDDEEDDDDNDDNNDDVSLSLQSSPLSAVNDGQNQRIVPKNCLSILEIQKIINCVCNV